jgi:SAM-dependent methyltransferase
MLGLEFPEIKAAIPGDHSRISSAEDLLGEVLASRANEKIEILDLGCGDGRGLDLVRSHAPNGRYRGVDIEGSPEVRSRNRTDGQFLAYDGVNLPFDQGEFDVVYSRQVLEHVRHPDLVVREVRRVLRTGGYFVGSLSNLEPYHSFSIFNYTPYGVFRLMEDNGLALRAMRPGPEGISMTVRQLSGRRITGVRLAYPLVELGSIFKNGMLNIATISNSDFQDTFVSLQARRSDPVYGIGTSPDRTSQEPWGLPRRTAPIRCT